MGNFKVVFDGFETEEQAKAFISWYEGAGEQDASNWLEGDDSTTLGIANVDMDKYHANGGIKANSNNELIVPLTIHKK